MDKEKFLNVVEDGIRRGKKFMIVKILSSSNLNPKLVIVQGADIIQTAKTYARITSSDLRFYDTDDRIEDVLMTNNLNELSWFAY